ncbi:hypothetical protein GX586_11260 [bacterium]|nr:hypothetical protein [bacterium]
MAIIFGFDGNAFAAPVSERDHTALIEALASRIVRWRMAAPAVVTLESLKPVARIAGQALVVAAPLVSFIVPPQMIADVCDLLQTPENIDALVAAIERAEERQQQYTNGGREDERL